VLRREMKFNEGDAFSNEKLKRSEQRIRNLGFFETVQSESKQTKKKDRTDVVFNVKEKQTGQFSVGGGFSSSNGALANVGIEEKNFLGKGQDLRAKFTLAERATQLDFGFTEPYFYGKNMALGLDVFKTKTTYADESSFDNDTTGAGFRLGYMITEKSRHSWNYSYKDETIEGIKTGASDFITNQQGEYTTSAISHRLSFFGINDRFNPTKGTEWNLSNKLAGLGGTVSFFKTDIKHSFFYSIGDDYVISTHLKGGYIIGYNDDDVKLKDRYFLGADSFPGFETAGIGPRDTSSPNKDALGGNMMYTVRTELKVPIPGVSSQLGISGAFFGIAGAVSEIDENGGQKIKDDSTPRISVGFGIQWKSPFGPVRLDFAHAIMKEEYDRTQFFKFNFGAGF
jgi:outer membrane protein insertion porin family